MLVDLFSLTHLVDGLALGLVLGVALLLVRLLALRLSHLLKKIGSTTLWSGS